MLSPATYWTILLLVTAYSLWRGRIDERAAALICVAATVATVAVNGSAVNDFESMEMRLLAVDVLALAGFTWIALRSERFWPLWVAGLQLTTIMSHFLKLMDSDMIPKVYAAAERFWVYPIFLIIVVGTWRTSHRSFGRNGGKPLAS